MLVAVRTELYAMAPLLAYMKSNTQFPRPSLKKPRLSIMKVYSFNQIFLD
jgi:hypothetical protein